ncbi:hypothetical protein AYI69_g10780, partial [Smittium culicis]
ENEAELGSDEEDGEDQEKKKHNALNMRFSNLNWNNKNNENSDKDEIKDDEADLFYEQLDSSDEEAILRNDPMLKVDSESEGEDDNIAKEHLRHDLEADNKMVGTIIRDLTSGRLGAKSKFGSNYLLDDDEDYNDRQTRTERMLARRGLRKKLEKQEIKDANLSKIAKNPETAAFAQAALFRVSDLKNSNKSNSTVQAEDGSSIRSENSKPNIEDPDNNYDYEEVVDDWSISLLTSTNLVDFQNSSPATSRIKTQDNSNSKISAGINSDPHLFSDFIDNDFDNNDQFISSINRDGNNTNDQVKASNLAPANSFASFSDFNDLMYTDKSDINSPFNETPIKINNSSSVSSRVKFLLSKRKLDHSASVSNSSKKFALNST